MPPLNEHQANSRQSHGKKKVKQKARHGKDSPRAGVTAGGSGTRPR